MEREDRKLEDVRRQLGPESRHSKLSILRQNIQNLQSREEIYLTVTFN